MASKTYIAQVDGKTVGKRTTKDRTYTHCLVATGHDGHGLKVLTWCGRPDLAQKALKSWTFWPDRQIVEVIQVK